MAGNRAPTKSAKRTRPRPAAAAADVEDSQTLKDDSHCSQEPHSKDPFNTELVEGAAPVTEKFRKPRRKRDPVKGVLSAPRITIKLVTKRRVKADVSLPQKPKRKHTGDKIPPEAEETSCANVKLKSVSAEVKELVNTRRRGRSADKKAESTPQKAPQTEAGDRKTEEKLRKSARKSQPIPQSAGTAEPRTDKDEAEPPDSASKENSEVKRLVIRRRHRTDSSHIQESAEHKNGSSLAESVLEVSTVEESVLLSKKKKGKKKKRHRKDKVSEKVKENRELLSEQPAGDSADMQTIEKEFVGIPGLKLTRIRNPKARSRKKRSKFIWTLTLVKCKSKSLSPEDLSKAPGGLSKESEPPSEQAEWVDVSKEPESASRPAGSSGNTPQTPDNKEPAVHVLAENEDDTEKDEKTRKNEELVVQSEAAEEILPGEAALTNLANPISKDCISPVQVKVVTSPKKRNSLKQPFLIQKVPDAPELSAEADGLQSSAGVPENQKRTDTPLKPKEKPKVSRNTAKKKHARHKPWSLHQSKSAAPSEVSPAAETTAETETPTTEPEPQSEEIPISCEQSKSRKCSVEGLLSTRSVPGKPPQALPAPEGHQSCEAPLPEAIEPTSTDGAALQPLPVIETQQDAKPEEKPTAQSSEVLVLEPPTTDETLRPLSVQKPFKQAKKRRRTLIGQRFKCRKQKLPPKPITEEVKDACLSEGTTEPAQPSPGGILKTKYKKQQVSPSLPQFPEGERNEESFPDQPEERNPVEQNFNQEEKESLNEKADLDSADAQPGKTKLVKTIKHFIMPVVSARSSRVIKTPKRFMDDLDMSDLPRRQKKSHQLPLQPKGKKRDSGETGGADCLQTQDEDLLPEAQLDLDLSSAEESKAEPEEDIETLGGEKFSGKRRSLLRDPSFNWKVLEPAGEGLSFDQDIEKECEALLSAKDFFFDTIIDSSPKKKKSVKKQPTHLQADKKLTDKLSFGLVTGRSQKKLPTSEMGTDVLAEAQKGKLEEETSLTHPPSETEREKAKLKIEDLDTPGVVRKVSICMQALSSRILEQQDEQSEDMPDEFSIHTDISLPNKCRGKILRYLFFVMNSTLKKS